MKIYAPHPAAALWLDGLAANLAEYAEPVSGKRRANRKHRHGSIVGCPEERRTFK